jgi:uncharacterized phage protein (TIGR01671 family)
MRTIKFRGKKTSTGEWVYGSLIVNSSGVHTITQITENPVFDGVLRGWCFGVHPETVGQFTGLLDKNGVEIYEGDKIRWIGTNHLVEGIEFTNEIYWLKYRWRVKGTHNKKTFHADFNSGQVYNHSIEVIGNIH